MKRMMLPQLILTSILATSLATGVSAAENAVPPGARALSVNGVTVTVDELIARAKKSPSVCVTRGRVEEIRARIASDKTVSNIWVSLVRGVDASVGKPLDIPDHGGAWCHHFFCRKCASPLRSESPTRHVCRNRKCGEVHSGYPYDDVYIMNVHYRLANSARDAAFAYQLTGDRRYADHARQILLEYAKVYLSYEIHSIYGKGSRSSAARVGPQTLEESHWVTSMCKAYDMIANTLSDEDRATVREKILLPSARLIAANNAKIGNWQCQHLSAFGLVGLVCGDAKLVAQAVCPPYGYLQQLSEGVFDDGIWNECAWSYHFYTLSGLTHIVTALDNLGVPPPPRYRLMFDSAFGQVMPDFRFIAMHDSGRYSLRSYASYYELAWTWWKDPFYAWWLSQNKRDSQLNLTQGSSLPADLSAPKGLGSRIYPNSGLAVLRSNEPGARAMIPGNYVAIDFGVHGGWHGHPDKLNLTVFTRGELMVEDPGDTGYGNPRQWGWFRATLAHNTLVLDGTNQCPATGSCEAYATDGEASVVSCLAGEAYGKSRVGRLTALVGDVVLDCLWLRGDRPHDLEWAFHGRGDFSTPLRMTPVTMPAPKRPALFAKSESGMDVKNCGDEAWGWTHDNAEGAQDGSWQATWKRGKATLNLFQRAPAGVIRTGTGSASPASEECKLAVNRVAQTKDAAFATVLTLDGTTDVRIGDVRFEADGTVGFTATVKGTRYAILRAPTGAKDAYRTVVTATAPDGRTVTDLKAEGGGAQNAGK